MGCEPTEECVGLHRTTALSLADLFLVRLSDKLPHPTPPSRALRNAVSEKANLKGSPDEARILTGLKDIGFFDEVDVPRKSSLLDSMAEYLGEKLKYQPGERDMIVMQHKFKIIKADGTNVCEAGVVFSVAVVCFRDLLILCVCTTLLYKPYICIISPSQRKRARPPWSSTAFPTAPPPWRAPWASPAVLPCS